MSVTASHPPAPGSDTGNPSPTVSTGAGGLADTTEPDLELIDRANGLCEEAHRQAPKCRAHRGRSSFQRLAVL